MGKERVAVVGIGQTKHEATRGDVSVAGLLGTDAGAGAEAAVDQADHAPAAVAGLHQPFEGHAPGALAAVEHDAMRWFPGGDAAGAGVSSSRLRIRCGCRIASCSATTPPSEPSPRSRSWPQASVLTGNSVRTS